MVVKTCYVCSQRVLSHSHHLDCSKCHDTCHLRCLRLVDKTNSLYINRHNNSWLCTICISDALPFVQIDDDDEYDSCIRQEYGEDDVFINDAIFNPFDISEDVDSPLYDIDPDVNYFQQVGLTNNIDCKYYMERSFAEQVSKHGVTDQSFSILHANLRSLPKNFDSFTAYITSLKHEFPVMGVTENWLNDNLAQLYCLDGYNIINACRRDGRRGGGASLLLKDCLSYSVRPDLAIDCSDTDSLFVELNQGSNPHIDNKGKTIIGVVYRPPSGNVDSFNDALKATLNKLNHKTDCLYLMGDFNINLLNYDKHLPTSNFLDILYANSILPTTTKPTRVTKNSATLIDNIFCSVKVLESSTFGGVLVTDVSDHYPIFHINYSNGIPVQQDPKKVRNFCQKNIDSFVSKCRQIDWTSVTNTNDPEVSFSTLYSQLLKQFQDSFPLIDTANAYTNRKPWLTSALKNSIARKNWLYKISVRSPCFQNVYNTYRNKLTSLLRKTEKDHYEKLIEENKNNLRRSWQIIKSVINKNKCRAQQQEFNINGQVTTDATVISNKFNSFFANIGPSLAQKVPVSSILPTHYVKPVASSLNLDQVSPESVSTIISNLKDNSPGPDEIPPKILKLINPIIRTPLTHTINLSLASGYFPSELKTAKVIPIYKGGDQKCLSNYRPVSVLNSLSKVFEKSFYNQLSAHLAENQILHNFQFGFRPGHSTNFALSVLSDKITEALDNNETIIGLFLDFSKAFDTVDHNILLSKLKLYGVKNTSLNWVHSYLSDRHQYVQYQNVKSSLLKVLCGVPQGSILGPLFFLLYINDMDNISKLLFYILFADDTNAFYSHKKVDEIINTFNGELGLLTDWLHANKLTLNIKKTHYIIFTNSNIRPTPNLDIIIDNQVIDRVSNTRFLGVIIDENLRYKHHVNHIKPKVARGVGILARARKFFSIKTLINLYYAFIHPYLLYCVEIWGNTCTTYTDPLFKLQKRAVRIITGSSRTTSSSDLFKLLKIIPFPKLHTSFVYIFLYKLHQNMVPPAISSTYQFNSNVHSHVTRHSQNLHVNHVSSALRHRSLRHQAITLHNSDDNIDYDISYQSFKFFIKTILLFT